MMQNIYVQIQNKLKDVFTFDVRITMLEFVTFVTYISSLSVNQPMHKPRAK